MTAPPRVDRRAIRRREPAALATILVGQLTAYRCSTIYAPSATKLDSFVREEALPRLRAQHDVRTVIIDAWEKKVGPTVKRLVDEVHRQLEIEPDDPDAKPLVALESALRRAERRSDESILIVLYRLEQLLDDKRDPAEVARFVDALSRMAAMPMNGLHLVLGVKEEDLGAFRDLLRGRWRLLANDIRIRPSGKKWLLSLPLVIGAYVSSNTATVAAVGAVCVSSGAAAGTVATVQICETKREQLAECKQETERLRRGARKKSTESPPPPPEPEGSSGDTSTGSTGSTGATDTDTTGTSTDATGTSTDVGTTAEELGTTGAALVSEPPVAPKPIDLCAPSWRDGPCGECVRAQCCVDLKACKKPKWRACVLKGKIGDADCTPEAIEKECRTLALCALEYVCRPACFNN